LYHTVGKNKLIIKYLSFMNKFKKKSVKQNLRQLILFSVFMSAILISCKNEENNKKIEYDPTQPTELLSFYPNEGRFQEKVILTGKNFPTDPNLVRVYFNSRRAPVIGSTGTSLYVMAPRLPGDVCVISMVVGNDSLIFNETFLYEETITVTTIAGNGNRTDFKEGDLANAIFQPRYLCMDNDGNLFVSCRGEPDINQYFCLLSERENTFTRLQQSSVQANIPCVDLVTGVVSVATEQGGHGQFYTCNPSEFWAPRIRNMIFIPGDRPELPLPTTGWKHCMVVNPEDGMIYVRWYGGQLVKLDPNTFEAQVILMTEQCNTYGMTFRPGEPNILYLSFWNDPASYRNSICSVDVTDPENTFRRLSSPFTAGGHRDGDLSVAEFRQPSQIFCDADGFIWVADFGNHCIRRISPDNQVETVLGIPGVSGWKDGSRDEALFDGPRGIAIRTEEDGTPTVYVADYWNARIRKLSNN